ncbi:outer membrane beta-barrel protein [Tunicatimonas pelagia]|uniref:outer membrane beta-barrel protein n=1 Tax=Tunicatimonas pelagia TaxID=931531 RepID=UPI0026661A77|nr:outer membrane beta-barrel protein [Tunicatimonas pelagia]WKN43126.1 outer membrane beta-barrel protein [Tunicatimonas pelagia]
MSNGKPLFFCLMLGATLLSWNALAQDSTQIAPQVTLSGYTDVYYATFSDESPTEALQPYTTVSPRSDHFGLNVAQLSVNYQAERVRGTVTLHYGDIAQATWSETFSMVQEANMGIMLFEDWWLDAGFFATHIGTESFLPKNNLLSSTAVATFNEPFFQSGARVSYEGSEDFSAQFHVVSGYNFFLDVNDAKSVGVLLSYHLSEEWALTYTNLLGRESLDDVTPSQLRFYHNLYLNGSLGDKLQLIIGGDLGTQTNSQLDNSDATALMYNALGTIRYQFTSAWSVTARGEIFSDPEGFISGTLPTEAGREEGLQLTGLTLGAEYRPTDYSYVRIEGRSLVTDNSLVLFDQGANDVRYEWMVTTGFYFDHIIR